MTIDSFKKSKEHITFSKHIPHYNTHFICNSIGSVGNVAFVINHLYFMDNECKSIYIDFNKKVESGWDSVKNPYDEIFDQHLTDDFLQVTCFGYVLTDYDEFILNDIRNCVKGFFKFNDDLIAKTKVLDVGNGTLGVHVRMHDMNAWHGHQYGFVYYENYVEQIDKFLNSGKIKNIFVASDNHETLHKLISRYGNLVIFSDIVSRRNEEHIDGTEDSLREKSYSTLIGSHNFISPFIDLLILMKCEYLIGRKYSNFFHAAIMLGKTKFENIFELS